MLFQHLFPVSLSSATVPRVLTQQSGRKHDNEQVQSEIYVSAYTDKILSPVLSTFLSISALCTFSAHRNVRQWRLQG